MTGTLSPGQAAEQSGFSLDTLRYYERIGLLDGISRAPSGHRRFGDDDLEWLGVLRCLRDTGMPIAQMHRYASDNHPGLLGEVMQHPLITATLGGFAIYEADKHLRKHFEQQNQQRQ